MRSIVLYHGSRGGIDGAIKPVSRPRCDFGMGFYMGTNPDQAKTLVSTNQSPYFYKLELKLDALQQSRILRLDDMDWAYFVLYNRGRLDTVKKSPLYKKYASLAADKDLIIGPIADDAMNEVMSRFIHGDITDRAFLECIRGLNDGIQYVAKTAAACSCVNVLEKKPLYGKELEDAIQLSENRRREGKALADTMQRKYRREGKYFDEILQELRQKGSRGPVL